MPYPTVDEVRERWAHRHLDSGKYPDPVLQELIDEFAGIAERARGVAFDPRTTTEIHTLAERVRSVELMWPFVSAVSTVSLDGVTVDGPHSVTDADRLVGPFGCGDLSVTYTHGIETPAAIRRACMLYVYREAVAERGGGQNPAVQRNPELGALELQRTPNWSAGRFTGWPDVDRLLNSVDDHRNRGPA